MFRNLMNLLFNDHPHPPALTAPDAEIAVAALLVRIARSDEQYTEAEKIRIDRVLAQRRGLTPEQARERREQAEEIEADAPDTVRFTRQIKERIALSDRVGVIEALWDVAMADEKRDADEEAMIRLAASLLGVNDVDSARARQRVMENRGLDEF